jgi:glucan phosphoethanolaminetransferase (alkaline phosphatase superfamily)
MNNFIFSSFLAVTAGFIANIYEGIAKKYGWPIGKLFTKHKGWVFTIAWLMIISGTVELMHWLSFLLGILSAGLSFVLAVILTYIFKYRIQWIAILILIGSIVIWIAGGARIVET